MNEKFEDYTGLLEKYNVNSIRQLDNMITSIEKENKRLHKYLNMQTMALCDFHNRETAQMKWADKRPEFNLDKYYEVCMEESQQIYYKNGKIIESTFHAGDGDLIVIKNGKEVSSD